MSKPCEFVVQLILPISLHLMLLLQYSSARNWLLKSDHLYCSGDLSFKGQYIWLGSSFACQELSWWRGLEFVCKFEKEVLSHCCQWVLAICGAVYYFTYNNIQSSKKLCWFWRDQNQLIIISVWNLVEIWRWVQIRLQIHANESNPFYSTITESQLY